MRGECGMQDSSPQRFRVATLGDVYKKRLTTPLDHGMKSEFTCIPDDAPNRAMGTVQERILGMIDAVCGLDCEDRDSLDSKRRSTLSR